MLWICFLGSLLRAKLLQSCLTLCDPMNCIACQVSLSMGFSRQECCSGSPCFPPGIKPLSLMPPALAGRSLRGEGSSADLFVPVVFSPGPQRGSWTHPAGQGAGS